MCFVSKHAQTDFIIWRAAAFVQILYFLGLTEETDNWFLTSCFQHMLPYDMLEELVVKPA